MHINFIMNLIASLDCDKPPFPERLTQLQFLSLLYLTTLGYIAWARQRRINKFSLHDDTLIHKFGYWATQQQNQGQKYKYYKLLSELGQPSVDITEFPLGPATYAY